MWDDDGDKSNGKNELAKCEYAVDLYDRAGYTLDGDKKDVAEKAGNT